MSPLPRDRVEQMLSLLQEDVGRGTGRHPVTFTTGDAARLAEALGPGSGAGPGTMPPTAFCPDPLVVADRLGLPRHRPLPHLLDGGTTWEWLAPIPLEEEVGLEASIVGVEAKRGAAHGVMFLTTVEVTCTDASGGVLARSRGVSVSYRGGRA
ncbi:MAG: MaoC family dehydratase N-terminal domain-containing protein [Actinobacteria bacterium]|nr:MaoC family dehydratase N-terminal domain-containing protein [Actinomycetota bacterium]